jgi:hypothetical protein
MINRSKNISAMNLNTRWDRKEIYCNPLVSQFEYDNDCVSDVTMALPHTTRQLLNRLSVEV